MTDREKLIELIGGTRYGIENCSTVGTNFQRGFIEKIANHLLANGVTFTPAIPGPSDADPNIMELCFHNGERHMKEKMLAKLAQLLEGLDYHKVVFICKCLEDI